TFFHTFEGRLWRGFRGGLTHCNGSRRLEPEKEIIMSIATKRGDQGQTDLVGRVRVSTTDLRVEWYGTIDELTAQLGFPRAICRDPQVGEIIKGIQRDLF